MESDRYQRKDCRGSWITYHSLDLTNATAGQMLNDSNQTLGDAHRAASHDKK